MFLALFAQTCEDNKLFYIIPNLLHSNLNCTKSYNQSYITFQQFVNSDTYSSLKNVTLVFLPGYHTFIEDQNISWQNSYSNYVFNECLVMIGISTEVFIHDILITFFQVQMLQIENLSIRNSLLYMFETSQTSLFSVTFINSNLYIHYVLLAQLHNCKFSDGTSHLYIDDSKVILSGKSKFFNNYNSALISHSSTITLLGNISFINNTGVQGGAMALYSSTVYLASGLNLYFINNSADETGGAIHIEPDMTHNYCPECFYESQGIRDISFYYYENSAQFGGDNIYGTSLALCADSTHISHHFLSNDTMSSVSSDPTQVCLCDSDGQPQCETASSITIKNRRVHPGETITIPAVIVGGDYGTTVGTVHANFMPANLLSVPLYQYSQWINNHSICTDLQYTVYSSIHGQNFTMYLTVHSYRQIEDINQFVGGCDVTKHNYDSSIPTPIILTILSCPMGFSLLEKPSRCDCDPILLQNEVKCIIMNGRSYFSWNTTLWISTNKIGFAYAKHCPLNYCNQARKEIELTNNPSAQCTFNRAGRLCGGCKEGYSLAIGSSHCIHCPNNNNLALLIFFTAAGFLLVFFINVLDITLTQGLLDGLIFYANIVWTYQSVLFPEQSNFNGAIIFLKTFIAWINLDFGIETCFVKGLTSVWKTWLQFVFPFYIWAIVGMMIFTARHSRILTKLYGNRAVPVLATLFLLSYMKLLRTITSIFMLSHILQYPKKSTVSVWSVDGNIDYFGLPHSLLLVAALIVQVFLWLPYTLVLLLHQQLQKYSHIRIFNWVTNLKPFFDVHFAPFKPAHRYWFGVLLLARGVLLAIFSSSFATPKNTNLLLLLIIILALLLYMATVQPYRNKVIFIVQSSFLANILLLCAFVLYTETHENKFTLQMTTIGISTGVVFLQFCGIIICNVIRLVCHARCNSYKNRAHFEDEEELDENFSTNYRFYVMKALF